MVSGAPPDLLITDLVIPDLTGWSLFARARRRAPTLPIVAMSGAETGFSHQETALASHAVFPRKPFDLDHLLKIFARLLDGDGSDSRAMPPQRDDAVDG